jgi:hypothetical protein
MYLVISTWEALPGKEAEFDQAGPAVASVLRREPGVLFVEAIKNGNQHIAVHGYHDEATYHAIIDNPNGQFAKAIAAKNVESVAKWISSERGETMPHV